jgi:hypothetical protein
MSSGTGVIHKICDVFCQSIRALGSVQKIRDTWASESELLLEGRLQRVV